MTDQELEEQGKQAAQHKKSFEACAMTALAAFSRFQDDFVYPDNKKCEESFLTMLEALFLAYENYAEFRKLIKPIYDAHTGCND